MKKKILISSYNLDIGGIETSLITLIDILKEYYDITLVLEKKEGIFLDTLDKNIKVISYTPSEIKFPLLRKTINLIKRLKFTLKHKNKYYASITYATYSLPSAITAKIASKKPILYVHSEYLLVFNNNKEQYKKFFENIGYKKYKKIIFVSNNMKQTFLEIMKYDKGKTQVIPNQIKPTTIIKKSKEQINDMPDTKNKKTFIYVGRLTQIDKKITRIINTSKKLKQDGYNFSVIIIGDGKDKKMLEALCKTNKLENTIHFLGKKQNPYPYIKQSDCLILTSDYEGFPLVYLEAMILNTPIITTNVSDSEQIIKDKYGIVTQKDENEIYKAMKNFLENGYEIKEKFNIDKFNEENKNKLIEIIGK